MKKPICILMALTLILLLVPVLVSQGLLTSSVTLTSSGTITIPNTYSISQVGTVTKVTNPSGTVVYSSSDANSAFYKTFEYVKNGGNVIVQAGTYIAQGAKIHMLNCNGVNVTFQPGSLLTITNGANANVFYMQNSNNCVIDGINVDGNGGNQVTTGVFGWGICLYGSSNNIIRNSNIYNCVLGDVGIFSASTPADTSNNIIENNVLGTCGWNDITAWGYKTIIRNNDISHASDVGIASYEDETLIQNNYIHDMDGSTGDQNSHYGIAVEGNGANGHNIIENNRIENCVGSWATGIAIGTGAPVHSNVVRGNTIANCNNGIGVGQSTGGVVTQNQITSWGTQAGSSGITLSARSSNEIVAFNTLISNSVTPGIGAAIFIENSDSCFVYGNTLTTQLSAQSTGIYATASSNNLILKNTVVAKTGIQISDGSSNNNAIYGNFLSGCTTSVVNGGTGTISVKPSTSSLNINYPSLNGGGTPSQGIYLYTNSSQPTITLSPNSGFTATLNVDGTNVALAGNAYTLSMNEDHVVYVLFSKT